MFLQFFIWGAWLPLIYSYMESLKYEGWQITVVLNMFAIASFVGMFFSNQFADRNFAAEKFLAVSHLIGGLAILAQIALQTDPYSGRVFVFRRSSGSLIKLLWLSGDGMNLFAKGLEHCKFVWPFANDSAIVDATSGIDWRAPKCTWQLQICRPKT